MRSRPHAGSRRRPRGFTLLEMLLAASIGAVIMIACVGVFFVLERSDRALSLRAEQTSDLQRTRLVMARTFGRLLLSDAPRPRSAANLSEPNRTAAETAAAAAAAANLAPPASPPPPRLVLAADARLAGRRMTRRVTADTESGDAIAPQRLELVLSESPVPTTRADPFLAARLAASTDERGRRAERDAAAKATAAVPAPPSDGAAEGDPDAAEEAALPPGDAAAQDEGSPVRALRGVFEFRPQRRMLRVGADADALPAESWELWWRPLPRLGSEGHEPGPSRAEGEPYLVASNLRYARWRVFDDRVRKDAVEVTWTHQLPAYVELEAETAAGLAVNWMFEVGFASGPETPRVRTIAPPNVEVPGPDGRPATPEADATPRPQAPPGGKERA